MTFHRRDLAKLGLLAAATPLAGLATAADDPPAPPALDALWADLEKDDETATRALLKLADRRDEAVAFLSKAMQPLRIDPDWLRVRLERLGSRDAEVWKPAFEELDYFDPRLGMELEALMKDVTKAPARQRLVAILSGYGPDSMKGRDQIELRKVGDDGFNFTSNGGSWWAEHKIARINGHAGDNPKKKWTRAVRAIALLEHDGSPGARAVLKAMATGEPDAQPTSSAKAALERLNAKGL